MRGFLPQQTEVSPVPEEKKEPELKPTQELQPSARLTPRLALHSRLELVQLLFDVWGHRGIIPRHVPAELVRLCARMIMPEMRMHYHPYADIEDVEILGDGQIIEVDEGVDTYGVVCSKAPWSTEGDNIQYSFSIWFKETYSTCIGIGLVTCCEGALQEDVDIRTSTAMGTCYSLLGTYTGLDVDKKNSFHKASKSFVMVKTEGIKYYHQIHGNVHFSLKDKSPVLSMKLSSQKQPKHRFKRLAVLRCYINGRQFGSPFVIEDGMYYPAVYVQPQGKPVEYWVVEFPSVHC